MLFQRLILTQIYMWCDCGIVLISMNSDTVSSMKNYSFIPQVLKKSPAFIESGSSLLFKKACHWTLF